MTNKQIRCWTVLFPRECPAHGINGNFWDGTLKPWCKIKDIQCSVSDVFPENCPLVTMEEK